VDLQQNQINANPALSSIEITLDSSAITAFLEELLADLAEAPEGVRERALDLIKTPSELIGFEQGVATGAVVPLLLKPSQRLLDFRAAVRTSNFDLLSI
jgi:hypothetical protein